MRLALLCPTFPPDRCGVGDYTHSLAGALARGKHTVAIWTSQPDPARDIAGMRFFPVKRPWFGAALKTIEAELRTWEPDAIVLEYTPQIYAEKTLGVHPFLSSWITRLRKICPKAAITAHELNYPIEASLKGLVLGVPQWMQFLASARASSHVLFTYDAAMKTVEPKLGPLGTPKLSVLPVGSNISPVAPDPAAISSIRERHGLANSTLLLHFGGMHATHLLGFQLSALRALIENARDLRPKLVWLGPDQDQARELLPADLKGNLLAMGYLPPREISLWLHASDLVLAPFMDGVSTRRGSFMAAIAHGKACLTTIGRSSDPAIPWDRFCATVPVYERAFSERALELIRDPETRQRLGLQAQAFWADHFSWDGIAERLVSALS